MAIGQGTTRHWHSMLTSGSRLQVRRALGLVKASDLARLLAVEVVVRSCAWAARLHTFG